MDVNSNDPDTPVVNVPVELLVVNEPDITVSPTSLSARQETNQVTTQNLDVGNIGTVDLVWNLYEENPPLGFTPPAPLAPQANTDSAPVTRNNNSPLALGDWLFDIDAEGATGNNLILGVEFANGYYWVTGADPGGAAGYLYKIDTSGALVATYSQAAACTGWGGRDLAFDGTYLYYGCDDGYIHQVDPATGAPTGVNIPDPVTPARALAYDPATDHFWVANWDSNLYEIDRSGALINSFTPVGLSTYGMAWDVWSPGGPFLWLWSQDGPDPLLTASQVDPATGALTGVSFLGTGFAGEMSGGATISDQAVPGQVVFLGMNQGVPDRIGAYDLGVIVAGCAPADLGWLSADPTSGTTAPNTSTPVEVTFDSTGLGVGTYHANLCIESNDLDEQYVRVPVTLDVFGVPNITVDPLELMASIFPDTQQTQELNVCNTGNANLTWDLSEVAGVKVNSVTPLPATKPSHPVSLSLEANGIGGPTAPAPKALNADVSLVLDDGSRDNDIGIGGTLEFIWVNRFTPAPDEYPFELTSVQVYFTTAGAVNVGDAIKLVFYENTSGNSDPAVGSNYLGGYLTTVQALDQWNVYTLADPVVFNGPGDAIVGVIALEVPGTDYFPASMDQTVSQQRSWAGWWSFSPPPDPPLLPPDSDWTLIDAYFPGNWMVRGYGQTIETDNILWLTEAPTSGTVAPEECAVINVTFDSTGLALGEYSGSLLLESNDPDQPEIVVPVTLNVVEPDIDVTAPPLELTLYPNTTGTLAFTIANVGTGDLLWDLADNATWLTAVPDAGTIPGPGEEEVVLTFNAAGLAPGTYTATITITSNDPDEETITLQVTLTVTNYNFYLPLIQKH